MASEFDDHATVVVLEFLVKRLVAGQCGATPDNLQAGLARWRAAINDYKTQLEHFAFEKGTRPEVALNALGVLAEFDRVMQEVEEIVSPELS